MVRKTHLLVCLFLALNHLASAAVFPQVEMNGDDLQMISSPKVEAEFRLDLIRRAEKSIDLVIWDQRTDELVGLPVLIALKDAANRGVKVRFLLSWTGQMMMDFFNKSGRYLTNPPARQPIDFLVAGGTSMQSRGWAYFDGIHEKLLIVDGRWTLVTGRGHADEYLRWLDTAFVMRGPLVDQSIQVFQDIWEVVRRETQSKGLGLLSTSENPIGEEFRSLHSESRSVVSLSSEERTILKELSRWFNEPHPKDVGSSVPRYKARLLHHDFLSQLWKLADASKSKPYKFSNEERIKSLNDPVVEEIIRLISDPNSKDFRFYALSVDMHPKLKKAVLAGLKRGLKVQVFTNGKAAQKKIVPISIPFGWYRSLIDLDDLLQAGAQAIGLVEKDLNSAIYLHRKMAVVDDTVIFGSHNMNVSSTIESDEVSFSIQNQEFADQARSLFQSSLKTNGEVLSPEAIHQERTSETFNQWLASHLGVFYFNFAVN